MFAGSVLNAQTREYLDSLFNEYTGIKNPDMGNCYQHLTYNTNPIKCSFCITGEIKAHFNLFTTSQQKILKKLTERPSLQADIISPSGKFRIHYDKTGDNAPCYDYRLSAEENAHMAGVILDSAYSFEVEYLGYLPPVNNINDKNIYDVFITNFSAGSYGETIPETLIGEITWSSFIEIDNDFASCKTTGFDAVRVTAAHELFHAIQIGNYFYQPMLYKYFYEMNATAMEDFVFDNVNDYFNYKSYFINPSKPFYSYTQNEAYGLAVWPIFLKENFGFDIIRKEWELLRNNNPLKAIDLSLQEYNTTFRDQLNKFGLWSYYTGERKKLSKESTVFKDGEFYPGIRLPYSIELTKSEFSIQQSMHPLSNKFNVFVCSMNAGYIDTIVSIVTNGEVDGAVNRPEESAVFNYELYNYKAEEFKQISDRLFSRINSEHPEFYKESDIVNNKLHEYISETDFAFPVPFSYTNRESNLFLPVAYDNSNRYAGIKVYSVSMSLVYSGEKEISKKNGRFVVCWNGLDIKNKKLPTGVYIYVTNLEDKIKTGKLVIKNE